MKMYVCVYVDVIYVGDEPKVRIKLLLISYLLAESFVFASASILLLVPFAVLDLFDPYSPLNF